MQQPFSLSGFLRKSAVIAHDFCVSALSFAIAFRLFAPSFGQMDGFVVPQLVAPSLFAASISLVVYALFGLYRSRWRFASLPDLANIFLAVLALNALGALGHVLFELFVGKPLFAPLMLASFFVLTTFMLSAPRLSYRYWRFSRARRTLRRYEAPRVLLVGRPNDLDNALQTLEGHAQRLLIEGLVCLEAKDLGLRLRGHKVLGLMSQLEALLDELEQKETSVRRIIFLPSALTHNTEAEQAIALARRAGLEVSRFDNAAGLQGLSSEKVAVAPLRAEDILIRPMVALNEAPMRALIAGKRVCVTGGGGSIGRVLCQRIAELGAAELCVLDMSEAAMHGTLRLLADEGRAALAIGHIADVRDKKRLKTLFTQLKPQVVFHAAALKHVPYLETDWQEGVRTNTFGTQFTLEAAHACGAEVFVLISTDKAVHPVSVLGITKRAAEVITAAFDAQNGGAQFRALAVRFGNVLGSAGSVSETFAAQIASGGPVSVTHPEMVRYFMTIREAVDLVLSASAHALSKQLKASLYVLNMGQPVRILDLARRMIRLAGFEPDEDIKIHITSIRAGERLHESLFSGDETQNVLDIEGVLGADMPPRDYAAVEALLARVEKASKDEQRDKALELLRQI